jgi:hypothetical protein
MDGRPLVLTLVLAIGCVLGLVGGVYGVGAIGMLNDVPCLTASLNTSWPAGLPCSEFDESKTVARYLMAIGAVSTGTLAVMLGTSGRRMGASRRD